MTYTYECPDCGHTFEVEQRIVDEPLQECPQCFTLPRRLVLGGQGFLLKGSGWAKDRYS